jgi:hypothetical protein
MTMRSGIVFLSWVVLGCNARPSSVDDGGAGRAKAIDARAAVCSSADGGSAVVAFAQIQQIFTDNCVLCHAAGSPLNLTASLSWNGLVGQAAPPPDSCGGTLVVPGDPSDSYLYVKLTSPTPCYGSQMPLGEFFAEPLPSCVVAMVGRWIEEGAPSDQADAGTVLPADAAVDAPR